MDAPSLKGRRTFVGLGELERRLGGNIADGENARILLRWGVDGRVFLSLSVRRETNGLRYVWLADDGSERRVIGGLAEVELLLMRQLREPAGEDVLVYLYDATAPFLRFWAMIAAGDRLACVWTEEDES